MRKQLYRLYNALQRALVPGLRNSQFAYKEALFSHSRADVSWLDLGCGHRLLPDWMPASQQEEAEMLRRPRMFVGVDADAPSLRKNHLVRRLVAGNIEVLSFRDQSFELITANMVIEHVENPDKLLREVHRVLKPGGEFLFHTPNAQGYTTLIARLLPHRAKVWLVHFLQGREEGDIFPTFYRLNSPLTVKKLAAEHGLEVGYLSLEESSAQSVMLGPLVIFELLLIRALRWGVLRKFRTNLIVVLSKPVSSAQ